MLKSKYLFHNLSNFPDEIAAKSGLSILKDYF